MSDLKKRIIKICAVTLAAWLFVLGLFYFAVVHPKQKKICELNSKLSALENQANKDSVGKVTLEKMEKNQELSSKVENFIIDCDSWINIMPYVSSVAQKVNVSMFSSRDASVRVGVNPEFKDLKKVDIKQLNVSFNSSFYRFAKFVNELESGEPVVFIKEFDIQRSADSTDKNEVKMELRVIVSKAGDNLKEFLASASTKN